MANFKKGDIVEYFGTCSCLSLGHRTKGEVVAINGWDDFKLGVLHWLFRCNSIVLLKVYPKDLILPTCFNWFNLSERYYILPVEGYNLVSIEEVNDD